MAVFRIEKTCLVMWKDCGRTQISHNTILLEIQKFFESPEGKKEFEEWKAQRAGETDIERNV